MQLSECQWLRQRIDRAVRRETGNPHWGTVQEFYCRPTRTPIVAVHSLDVAESLPELFQIIRRVLAESRYHHAVHIQLWLKVDWRCPHADSYKSEAFKSEWDDMKEQRSRDNAALREREFKFQQLRAEGVKVHPDEFEPHVDPPSFELDGDEPIDRDPYGGEPHPLAAEYKLCGILNEDGFFVAEKWAKACEQIIGYKVESSGG